MSTDSLLLQKMSAALWSQRRSRVCAALDAGTCAVPCASDSLAEALLTLSGYSFMHPDVTACSTLSSQLSAGLECEAGL